MHSVPPRAVALSATGSRRVSRRKACGQATRHRERTDTERSHDGRLASPRVSLVIEKYIVYKHHLDDLLKIFLSCYKESVLRKPGTSNAAAPT